MHNPFCPLTLSSIDSSTEGSLTSLRSSSRILPTFDELIGRNGVSADNYNDYMLGLLKPEKLNVLTIHAEVEGIACLEMFDRFVKIAQSRGASFVPLGTFIMDSIPFGHAAMVAREISGRYGWVSCQSAGQDRMGVKTDS